MSPILVLGAPRSGTTLMRRFLDAHSRICCPPETSLLGAAARFIAEDEFGEGLSTGPLSGLSFLGFSRQEVLARLRRFIFGFHEEYARRQGCARWAEKTAFDAFYIPAIEDILGNDVKYVCLLRHGLDVASSMQELCDKNGAYPRELHRYIVRTSRPLDAFAMAWVDVTQAILALAERRPRDTLLVRYEELVKTPERELKRVFAHVGEDWEPQVLTSALTSREELGFGDWKTYAASAVYETSVGRSEGLGPYTKQRLARTMNPTLTAAGYAAVSVTEVASDEEAQRKYQLGLLVQGLLQSKSPKDH